MLCLNNYRIYGKVNISPFSIVSSTAVCLKVVIVVNL